MRSEPAATDDDRRREARRGARRWVLAVVALLAVAVAACQWGGESGVPAGESAAPAAERVVTIYSHARHGAARMAKVAGSDPAAQCRLCHPEAGKGARVVTFPAEETCYACHARADRGAPTVEACGLCHVRSPGGPSKAFVAATSLVAEPRQDPGFFHESHRSEACATCHTATGAAAGRENPGPTAPGLCASCHGIVRFSHEVHVKGQRLACEGCHANEAAQSRDKVCPQCGRASPPTQMKCPRCGAALPVAEPAKPGVARLMPTHKDCYKCHPGATAETPNQDCAYCHDANRLDLVGPREIVKLERGDVRGFSHADHLPATCTDCHVDGATRRDGDRAVAPTMEACRQCHAGVATFQGKPVPTSCATCHAVLRGPLQPASHGELVRPIDHTEPFRRHHGEAARSPANKCIECHDLHASCEQCHAMEQPTSHTLRFKRSEHGDGFTHARTGCVQCHTASFCSDCHTLTPPPNHRYTPGFMAPGSGHKLVARREQKRCFTCHAFGPDCSKCHP